LSDLRHSDRDRSDRHHSSDDRRHSPERHRSRDNHDDYRRRRASGDRNDYGEYDDRRDDRHRSHRR